MKDPKQIAPKKDNSTLHFISPLKMKRQTPSRCYLIGKC